MTTFYSDQQIIDMYKSGMSMHKIHIETNRNYNEIFQLTTKYSTYGKAISKYKKQLEKLKGICGIYFIKHSSGNYYLGFSKDVFRRVKTHITKLDKGSHQNKDFLRDFQKDPSLTFGIIAKCVSNIENIITLEQIEHNLIKMNMSNKKCYNKFLIENNYLHTISDKQFKRLFSNLIKNEDGCWINTKLPFQKYSTYFNWRDKSISKDRSVSAARAAYYFKHKKLPDNLVVCHKCDNPRCINPNHLFLGTNYQNIQDRDNKGRGVKPRIDRDEVRKMLNDKKTVSYICKKMNCSSSSVRKIAKELGIKIFYPPPPKRGPYRKNKNGKYCCNLCKKWKHKEEFAKDSRDKYHGISSQCKECKNKYRRKLNRT